MLLKGVNKRVIIIKNPESEIFEEAYFIIKSGNVKGVIKQSKENEMVMEANRIITDYHNQQVSIIEKNGMASSIGGDISELDNFLNGKKDCINTKKTDKKTNNTGNIDKPEKKDKNKKDYGINQSVARLSDEEIFEDEKFFENIQTNTEKTEKYDSFCINNNFAGYSEEVKPYKSAFGFISSKKTCSPVKNIPMPPKSFFIGVGFMSAVIILIRIIEFILLR